jgi:hypothetical protein
MKTTCLPSRIGFRQQFLILQCWLLSGIAFAAAPAIEHDVQNKRVTFSDAARNLVMRLNYDGRCLLDRVSVDGRAVVPEDTGVCSAIKVKGQWFTTRAGISAPQVTATPDSVTVAGIRFGGAGVSVSETWRFTVREDRIVWRIDREYPTGCTLEDTYFPGWDFCDMSTWTGGLLGHGGVAWCKLFDAPNASYGVHNGKVTFWNKDQPSCLRIEASSGGKIATRFTRQPSGVFSLNYSISEEELQPKHGLSRFRRAEQDIWRAFSASPGRASVEMTLSAPFYDETYDRGHLKGLDGRSIREICHTIARIGAVDERILGSNGYYSDVAVLHEPWLAQMGLAIDDPDYDRALADSLDFQRQHAIGADGRVKSRWAGGPGDEMPGTYDSLGFYECQWGWLMDSQPSWVINVAELFDLTADIDWLQRQKPACELALDYLLRRDADANGLVEMMTSSHKEAKGSDWIDVVWASHENALVNAQLYWAMTRWAGLEDLLGDSDRARRYAGAADKLKRSFNRNTDEGGFWDAQRQCYVYWRDKDGSPHGVNGVLPVNFSAIGYGLCDEPSRRAAILDRMEGLMRKEGLFFWPLCFTSYAKEEVHPNVNWPFPAYENGDLFLAWGELGTRAYAGYDAGLALKYVKNVLAQYAKDGLAFQRYLRLPQTGAGSDILANNCSIVVGLYRNIYGLQPKFNRLYLEPHLIPELNGTQLRYGLRGKSWRIDLNVDDYAASVDGFTLRSKKPFAVNVREHTLEYFSGPNPACALAVDAGAEGRVELSILSWPDAPSGPRKWTESVGRSVAKMKHVVFGLTPNTSYKLNGDGVPIDSPTSDRTGKIAFEREFSNAPTQTFELLP